MRYRNCILIGQYQQFEISFAKERLLQRFNCWQALFSLDLQAVLRFSPAQHR